jgi:RNA polymerase sigma-70 factor (ECF subfamily)
MASSRDEQFEREALPFIDDVYRFALALTGSPPDAEDAAQETYLRAYKSWHTYTPGSECRRWLFTICKNVVRNRPLPAATVELDASDAEAETLAAVLQHSALLRENAEFAVDRPITLAAIDRAIAQLPEPFRTAVLLVDVEDQSYQSAAELLSVPIGTVRSRLFRGRRLLQETLIHHARDIGLRAAPPASA